jgi:hypothetical protein
MNEITEIKKAHEETLNIVNRAFDHLLRTLGGGETTGLPTEYAYPLTTDTNIFIGKKPAAVLFGEERVDVKTWHDVYTAILKRCNQDTRFHQMLIDFRGRLGGKIRTFLSDRPDGMIRPVKIDEDMYAETHYGSATLMHILVNRILSPVGFDCYGVSLILKE